MLTYVMTFQQTLMCVACIGRDPMDIPINTAALTQHTALTWQVQLRRRASDQCLCYACDCMPCFAATQCFRQATSWFATPLCGCSPCTLLLPMLAFSADPSCAAAAAACVSCRDITERHRRLAEIIEMIHTASLVHDDVLDDCSVRRGEERTAAQHVSLLLFQRGLSFVSDRVRFTEGAESVSTWPHAPAVRLPYLLWGQAW
jgi:hypothetical protein